MQRGFQLLSTMLVGFLVITATNGAEPAGAKKADNTATNAVDRDHSTTTPIDRPTTRMLSRLRLRSGVPCWMTNHCPLLHTT